jgi:hypothetical protein
MLSSNINIVIECCKYVISLPTLAPGGPEFENPTTGCLYWIDLLTTLYKPPTEWTNKFKKVKKWLSPLDHSLSPFHSYVIYEIGRIILFLLQRWPLPVQNSFWNHESYRESVGLLEPGISPVARLLPTQVNTSRRDADIHASSWIRTTIQAFERTKTLRAQDRAATVIGVGKVSLLK